MAFDGRFSVACSPELVLVAVATSQAIAAIPQLEKVIKTLDTELTVSLVSFGKKWPIWVPTSKQACRKSPLAITNWLQNRFGKHQQCRRRSFNQLSSTRFPLAESTASLRPSPIAMIGAPGQLKSREADIACTRMACTHSWRRGKLGEFGFEAPVCDS